jgi:hypothetical protein
MRSILFVLLFAGCDPAAELSWYRTCGDPSCQGYQGPTEGLDVCDAQVEGETCEAANASCDLEDPCNVRLICATEDPTEQEGGCPISLKKHKRDIRYLSDAERDAAARAALEVPLATWRYNWDDAASQPHLGFMIDDVGRGPLVTADGGHVDLYGYTSATLAAVQAQAKALDAERARNDALERRIAALEQKLGAAR